MKKRLTGLLVVAMVCFGMIGYADTLPTSACMCSGANCSTNNCFDCYTKCTCSTSTTPTEKEHGTQSASNWTQKTVGSTALIVYTNSDGSTTAVTLPSGATYWVGDVYSATGMVQVGYEMENGEITKVGWCYKIDIPGMTSSETPDNPSSAESKYDAFQRNVIAAIDSASNGATVYVKTDTVTSFTNEVMEKIAERRDITVELTYSVDNGKYTIIIPAGAEVPTEVPYAGFNGYLAGLYGRTEVE